MFIYKITVIPLNKVYIGFDTGPSYKLKRWRAHCQNFLKNPTTKLYKAMTQYGLENCNVEILEDNFTSILSLALAEIEYIKKYNSYEAGLNSTRGGDGLGRHILHKLSEEEILMIKQSLGESFKDYNTTIKWANTSLEKRKKLTSHLHTEEIYKKKSETLKKFYEYNPEAKKSKGIVIKKWQKENRELLKEKNRINGLKGAEKVSKNFFVEKQDGTVLYFKSKSEFNRLTGQWANTIIRKTEDGSFYNGYRIRKTNE
jgi:group I intron endonuclease